MRLPMGRNPGRGLRWGVDHFPSDCFLYQTGEVSLRGVAVPWSKAMRFQRPWRATRSNEFRRVKKIKGGGRRQSPVAPFPLTAKLSTNCRRMQSERGDDVGSETPYMDYIETAETVPLRFAALSSRDPEYRWLTYLLPRYGVRAPRIPGPDKYAPSWEVSDGLAASHVSRTLRQIHYFKDLGQDLGLSCYRCQ